MLNNFHKLEILLHLTIVISNNLQDFFTHSQVHAFAFNPSLLRCIHLCSFTVPLLLPIFILPCAHHLATTHYPEGNGKMEKYFFSASCSTSQEKWCSSPKSSSVVKEVLTHHWHNSYLGHSLSSLNIGANSQSNLSSRCWVEQTLLKILRGVVQFCLI